MRNTILISFFICFAHIPLINGGGGMSTANGAGADEEACDAQKKLVHKNEHLRKAVNDCAQHRVGYWLALGAIPNITIFEPQRQRVMPILSFAICWDLETTTFALLDDPRTNVNAPDETNRLPLFYAIEKYKKQLLIKNPALIKRLIAAEADATVVQLKDCNALLDIINENSPENRKKVIRKAFNDINASRIEPILLPVHLPIILSYLMKMK